MSNDFLVEEIVNEWAPVLDSDDAPKFRDSHRRTVTAVLLDNVQKNLNEERVHVPQSMLLEAGIPVNYMGGSSSTPGAGGIDTFDPIMISMVRRGVPNLIPFDIMGVQPMTGPVGLIFAFRSRYSNQTGSETFFDEVNTMFSSVLSGANTYGQKHVGSIPGNTSQVGNVAATGVYNTGTAMSRAQLEALGSTGNTDFPKMAFSIERSSVEAGGRALASEYTLEMAQDLKRVHGLDARAELINVLSTEIMAEINREMLRHCNIVASIGAQDDTTTKGIFDLDTDSNGRWSVEKWKGLIFQLDREANAIALATRRGKGNFVIMTADMASALRAASELDFTPALKAMEGLNVDVTGPTFAGVLKSGVKVFIDPYAVGGQYFNMGYKGQSAFDAGLFYCPYIPLQMVNAVDPGTYTPKFAFKTRYGVVANPFAEGLTKGNGALNPDKNVYYRKVLVTHLQ
jgi:hypothetical protein